MKKIAIISVRVDANIKKKLEIESQMKNTTLNTLVGQIITKHVNWDRFAEDVGFVLLTKPFVRAVLSHVPEKEMTNIAVTICRGAMKDAALYISGEFTLNSFIQSLDTWLTSSYIPFRHITDEDMEKYIIHHNLGSVFSQYLITVINIILNEFKYKASKQEITDQSIAFIINKS